MITNFMVKIGEIGRLIPVRRLGILKRIGISQFAISKYSSTMISLTLFVNLVIFAAVTLAFNKLTGVHPQTPLFLKIKFEANYLRIYWTDFHQIFTIIIVGI